MILFSILYLTTFITPSQDTIPVSGSDISILQKGIYITHNEFLNNSPSIRDDFTIKLNSRNTPEPFLVDQIEYQDPITQKLVILDGEELWGCFDGENLYIYHDWKLYEIEHIKSITWVKKDTKIITSDKYVNMNKGTESIIYSKQNLRDYMLTDLENGDIFSPYNKKAIVEIIKRDSVIYNQYVNSKDEKTVYMFIEDYNNKHPIVLPKIESIDVDYDYMFE